MTPKERAAMQQALIYLDAIINGEGVKPYELEGTAFTLREALAEQAEQEPVAYFHWDGKNCKDCIRSDCGQFGSINDACSRFYAAPVRTKDLTDDEIVSLINSVWFLDELMVAKVNFARAVIAADRERNK